MNSPVNSVKNYVKAPELLPQPVKNVLTRLPQLALKPWSKVPFSLQQKVLARLLGQAFGQALADDELAFLTNRTLLIAITDVPYQFVLTVTDQQQLQVLPALNEQQADVCFQADSNSLLLLMNQQTDPDTLFFQRKLLVTGDTELGLAIKNWLDDLDLSHLPKIVMQALASYCKLLSD